MNTWLGLGRIMTLIVLDWWAQNGKDLEVILDELFVFAPKNK